MKKEIKFRFRAWSNQDKCWCNSFDIHKTGLFRESPNNVWLTPEEANVVLMQFTGSLDKNGKEIFEGDIIVGFEKERKIVEWINGAFGYRNVMFPEKIEVIGNIYENPELLTPYSLKRYEKNIRTIT